MPINATNVGGLSGGIDTVLGIVVPILAFGVLGFAIYKGFKGPIDDLIDWVGEKFSSLTSESTESSVKSYGRRSPYGIEGGDISYR